MRFAYADPPYLGQGAKHYGDLHDASADCDDPEWHRALIERLCDEFPDGWGLSLHTPSLRTILNMCPDDVRVGAWVKPFAAFKKNVTRAWAWEPVILRGGRPIPTTEPTVPEPIDPLREAVEAALRPVLGPIGSWQLDQLVAELRARSVTLDSKGEG